MHIAAHASCARALSLLTVALSFDCIAYTHNTRPLLANTEVGTETFNAQPGLSSVKLKAEPEAVSAVTSARQMSIKLPKLSSKLDYGVVQKREESIYRYTVPDAHVTGHGHVPWSSGMAHAISICIT